MSDRYGISIGRILHPTDFSHKSELAFTHALRLCCATNGTLAILHVDPKKKHPDWDKYPSVRETLSRWQLLPPHASRSDVSQLGVQITKSSVIDDSPAAGILQYLDQHPVDMVSLMLYEARPRNKLSNTPVALCSQCMHGLTEAGLQGHPDSD